MQGQPQLIASFAASSAQNSRVPLNVAAKNGDEFNHVENLLVRLTVSVTAAATANAITQEQWCALLREFNFTLHGGKKLFRERLPASAFRALTTFAERRGPVDAAAVAANANTTYTKVIEVNVPYVLEFLQDGSEHMFPVGLLKEFEFLFASFAAAALWGTGNTINSVNVDVWASCESMDGLREGPFLEYGAVTPSSFQKCPVNVQGRLLYAAIADLDADGATTLGATDILYFETQGRETNIERAEIDIQTVLYNLKEAGGDALSDQHLPLPTSGSALWYPLIWARSASKLGDLPEESQVLLTLKTGAGAPLTSDQYILTMISRPWTEELVKAIGDSPNLPYTAAGAKAAVVAAGPRQGLRGIVPEDHPVAPYLPRKLNLAAARRAA